MSGNSIIRVTQTLVVIVLVLVSIYSFSQTPTYAGLISALSAMLKGLIPNLSIYDIIAHITVLLLFFLLSLAIGISGRQNRIKLLCILSFLLFLPSTQPFSRIDWFYFVGMGNTFEYVPPLAVTLGSGIVLIFCYVALICLARINDTKVELTQRGGEGAEVALVTAKQIQFTFLVLACAILVTSLAVVLLIIGETPLESLTVNFTGANLVLGVGGLAALSGFVYYYLKKNSD
jgi:hypothetical protein